GLALRKRFCATFDQELQAAATDEGLVLSLGERHSFPLEAVFGFLRADTVHDVLMQAILAAPMFASRWRWNATRALALLRFAHGAAGTRRRNAPELAARLGRGPRRAGPVGDGRGGRRGLAGGPRRGRIARRLADVDLGTGGTGKSLGSFHSSFDRNRPRDHLSGRGPRPRRPSHTHRRVALQTTLSGA